MASVIESKYIKSTIYEPICEVTQEESKDNNDEYFGTTEDREESLSEMYNYPNENEEDNKNLSKSNKSW